MVGRPSVGGRCHVGGCGEGAWCVVQNNSALVQVADPGGCVLCDDSVKNIEAAKKVEQYSKQQREVSRNTNRRAWHEGLQTR